LLGANVGFEVGLVVGDVEGCIEKDGAAVFSMQEKVPFSSNTHESKIPSATSPITSLMLFHPGRGSATAVNSVVIPSASSFGYGLVRDALPTNSFPMKYSEFSSKFTVLMVTGVVPSGSNAIFSPLRKNPNPSL